MFNTNMSAMRLRMPSQDPEEWKTAQSRQKVIKNIEEVMIASGSAMSSSRSPKDMENHVFQKAKTREDYLELVRRLMAFLTSSTDAKKQAMGMQGVPGMGVSGHMHQGPGGVQDPLNALTNLTKQQTNQGIPGHPGMMAQQQPRPPFQNYQMGPGGPRGMMPNMNIQGMRPDMYPGMQRGAGPSMNPQIMAQQITMQPNINQGMGSSGQPMMGPSGQSPGSAVMLASPGAGGGVMGPSPRSQPTFIGQTSPNTSLNTPGNPHSAPSPASRNPEQENMYLEKLKQLQKYVEPLKRMINKIEKDDERKKDHMKMKNLLEILTDPSKSPEQLKKHYDILVNTLPKLFQSYHIMVGNKLQKLQNQPSSEKNRLAYETLGKCQAVLEKLDLEFQKNIIDTTLPYHQPQHHIGQSLVEKLASQAKHPMFNHTLKRTFANVYDSLPGMPILPPSLPAKRTKVDDSPSENRIPDVLQGEIARLNPHFLVKLDPAFHKQSKSLHLICRLEDRNLPSVPPIAVTVPENYPKTSAICEANPAMYETTPFLQKVHKTLSSQMVSLPSHFSLTALLNLWEMSVRTASVSSVSL